MTTEEKEILDSETQDNGGDDVDQDTSSETEQRSDESNEDYEQRLEQERKKFEDQRTRAEKAEAKLKELRDKLNDKNETKEEPKQTEKSSDGLTREEAILFAKGLTPEEVEKAKHVAALEGVNPLVAAESDYFKHWQTTQKAEQEEKETQIGASKGSIKARPKADFTTPGLSDDDFKKMWKEKMGR